MARVIDVRGPDLISGEGLARFADDPNPAAARHLTVGGIPAYEVGNACGTCEFWFTRLEGASATGSIAESVDATRVALADGIASLDDLVVEQFARVLADGRYLVLLLDVEPRLVEPDDSASYFHDEQVALWGIDPVTGVPHDPATPYYRLPDTSIDATRSLFEFLVPLHPPSDLDADTLAGYASRLGSDDRPTAVALSVLDVKQPANWDDDATITEHWCLAHYLLDGHHKVAAAAAAGRPVRTLTYLAVDEGVSSPKDIARLRRLLGAGSD